MKTFATKSMIVGAGVLMAASPAFATTVDNINFPTGPGQHVFAGTINENLVFKTGDTLTGDGQILSIDNNSEFCAVGTSCSLSYQFGGFKLEEITPTTANFSGGFVNFFANGDTATPFLETTADPEPGTNFTLEGTLTNGGTLQAQNTAVGLLSVTGGDADAASIFDNDTYPNGKGELSDLLFNTSLSPSGNPQTTTFSGSADAHYIKPGPGQAQVSEPGTWAMLTAGLVLIGFGAAYRRRNLG